MLKTMDHFEIDKIKVFVDITLSTFDFPDVSRKLSGVHWQQIEYMGLVRQRPIRCFHLCCHHSFHVNDCLQQ